MKSHLFVAISLSVVLASRPLLMMIMMMPPTVSSGADELSIPFAQEFWKLSQPLVMWRV